MRTGNPTVKSHDSTLIQLNSVRSPPLSRHQLREIAKSPPLRTGTYGPGSSLHQKKSTDQVTHIFLPPSLGDCSCRNSTNSFSGQIMSNPMSNDSRVISSSPFLQHCNRIVPSEGRTFMNRPSTARSLGISCHVSGSSPVMSGTAMRRGFARSSERRGKVQFGIGRTWQSRKMIASVRIVSTYHLYPLVCSPFFRIKTNNMCKNCQGVFWGIRAVVRRRPSLRQPLVASSGWGQQQVLGGWCEAWRGSLDSAASSP